MFYIFDGFLGCCGGVLRVLFQPDGSVLVQVSTPDQSTTEEIEYDARHPSFLHASDTLNYREMVYCKDLLRYSEEKLFEKLSNKEVSGKNLKTG